MGMNRDLVIGLDCSTTACKAVVWDRHGRIAAEGRRSFPLLMPQPGQHEQPADSWWEATSMAIRQAIEFIDLRRLAAICIAHQRETFVAVDEDGRPLRPAMVWMDERSRPLLTELEQLYGGERVHQLTGKPLSINPSLGKIFWMRRHEPALFECAYKFLDVHAFLVHAMTGYFRTSWGSADPMGLFDMQGHRWASGLAEKIDLRSDQLAESYPPGSILGQVSREAAAICGLPEGLPVVAGLGDGQSAALGANITGPGQAYLNLGTAIVSGTFSDSYRVNRAFRTMNGGIPDTYLLETVLLGGTYIVNWFVEKFAMFDAEKLGLSLSAEEVLEAAIRKISPGCDGLMLVPYWNSVMNPYWDAAASGIIVGWRGNHDRRHLYRAIMEGIAFEQRLQTEGVEAATGERVDHFVVMGGGSRSTLWRQIVADITGKRVIQSASPEATALGVGILAAAAVGLYPGIREAAAAMTRLKNNVFDPDQRRHEFYTRLYEDVYRRLYPALQPYLGALTAAVSDGSPLEDR